jgi:hypothetical protein
MDAGSIPIADLSGGFDLQATLESGQTFLWRRDDGRAYEETDPSGGSAWYYTVVGGEGRSTGGTAAPDTLEVVRVRERDGLLEWEATFDADQLLVERLRLDDDLPAIFEAIPDDPLVAEARDTFPGLRLVDDPFFPCLVSFICSATRWPTACCCSRSTIWRQSRWTRGSSRLSPTTTRTARRVPTRRPRGPSGSRSAASSRGTARRTCSTISGLVGRGRQLPERGHPNHL